MLCSFVDLYHLIAYFTSMKYKVRCARKTAVPLIRLSNCPRWDGQKTMLPPSAQMLKSTLQVQPHAVNLQIHVIRRQLC